MSAPDQRAADLVDQIATLAQRRTLSVGVAESLTGGRISAALAAGADAGDWYRGAVVAYAPDVKFEVLDVSPGPVNTAPCAVQMARGALSVLRCEVAVSVTGVGGPGRDEGIPQGTVFIACARRAQEAVLGEHHLDGAPDQVVAQAVELALESILSDLLGS
jgi:nicotinamide-nucleotide amidase